MSVGLDNIQLMTPEAVEQVRQVVRTGGSSVQGKPDEQSPAKVAENGGGRQADKPKKWKVWDLEFEAQMRMLDNSVSAAAAVW